MNVVNTCHQYGYDQWIEGFVSKVLSESNICFEHAAIINIGLNEINLLLDDGTYTILINNAVGTKKDQKRVTCRANLEYILIKEQLGDRDSDSLYSVAALSAGTAGIEWSNDPNLFKSDFNHLNFYECSKHLTDVQIEDTMTLYVETVNNDSFNCDVDLRDFTTEERKFISNMYGASKKEQVFASNKSLQLYMSIENACVNKMVERCFDGQNFDANYTRWLLRCCHANQLCSRKKMIEAETALIRLHNDSKNGDESALNALGKCLSDFVRTVKPYYAIVCPE